ncbi:probable C-mannosyltransferase DPY19L1 [Amphibalanus amphitrite]|uniref:probable C-mannosyltransferase DPY19L1 n=1 Tax=Amphibalanus amphitrite TaxID=1232801 RepID=UPI001C9195F2|nr:probable C-mannosyltransferase DPY19L1 [Amphibalanus amphitrite]
MVVIRELATDDEDSDFSPGGQGPRPEDVRPRVRRRTKSSGDSRKAYGAGRRPAPLRPAAGRDWLWFVVAGVACGLLHAWHVSTLFENDRHFSHLSTLEREMSLRTEMGMYYSYFKTLAEAPDLVSGIELLMEDRLVEAPSTVNALQRFNLYPEVLLGTAYHGFRQVSQALGVETRECWKVDRGDSLAPVWSCVGLGTPVFFYLAGVWLCAAVLGVVLFIYGCQMSANIWGGLLTVACFFFNHSEATRMMWTPPLRESFAFPFLLAQMVHVCRAITSKRPGWGQVLSIGCLTAISLLFWQFSQFVLFTQTWLIYLLWVIGALSTTQLRAVLAAQMVGLLTAFGLLFGNRMLVCSPLSAAVLAMLLLLLTLEDLLQQLPALAGALARLGLALVGTIGVRLELSHLLQDQPDDSHIWNILRAKLGKYRDFDTMLYTCAAEFDFLPPETLTRLSATLLIPSAVLGAGLAVSLWGMGGRRPDPSRRPAAAPSSSEEEPVSASRTPVRPRRRRTVSGAAPGPSLVLAWLAEARGRLRQDLDVAYTLLQLTVFAVMALMVMRLKLFLTPMLCVATALLASRKFVHFIQLKRTHLCILAVLVSGMAVRGVKNIQEQHNIVGEYQNPELEELLEWVRTDTAPSDTFAGPMALMATVLLSTRRPVVNHPHYESAGARERTRQVYQIFSRRSAKQVYKTLKRLQVDYVVLYEPMCYGSPKPGCAMVDLWDVTDPDQRGRPPVCRRLIEGDPSPLLRVFENSQYVVLRVPAKYVEIPAPKQGAS